MKVFYSDSDDILKKELFKRIREDLQKEDGSQAQQGGENGHGGHQHGG